MTEAESRQLTLLRESLGDWCLADIKRAASPDVNLPRLAFVGLAAWIDTVSILYAGGKKQTDGFRAWKAFIAESGYFPNTMRPTREVRRLYDGLRNALLHEYGTRDVALTSGPEHRSEHWRPVPGTNIRALHLESLIEVFEVAFEQFLAELARDAVLRRRVLPSVEGLLQPVQIPRLASSETVGASVSDPVRLVIEGARAASATGPLDVRLRPRE